MEPVYFVVAWTLRILLRLGFRWRLLGMENIPRTGPLILACNHISYFDPLCHGRLVVKAGRHPRFFAKAELWENPVLRFILGHAKQIPVQRGTGESGPVEKALESLSRGEAVIIYPESTITTDPDMMPMPGKTGVARVAVSSGAPIVPIAVWGSQWVSPKGRKRGRRLGHWIVVKAGPPMRFDEFAGRGDDPEALREVVDRVIAELSRLVREIQPLHPLGKAVPELLERETERGAS